MNRPHATKVLLLVRNPPNHAHIVDILQEQLTSAEQLVEGLRSELSTAGRAARSIVGFASYKCALFWYKELSWVFK